MCYGLNGTLIYFSVTIQFNFISNLLYLSTITEGWDLDRPVFPVCFYAVESSDPHMVLLEFYKSAGTENNRRWFVL